MRQHPRRNFRSIAKGLALLLAMLAAPALADSTLGMLTTLDRGAWELRFRDGGKTSRVCLRTGQELIRMRHRTNSCQTVVLDDEANRVAVQYLCAGHGYGRTEIRRETRGLVQISSQGVVDGRPFDLRVEGRRVGACN